MTAAGGYMSDKILAVLVLCIVGCHFEMEYEK